MNTSGLINANSYWRNLGTAAPHWYTALSVMPRASARDATLPNTEIANSVFIPVLNHTLHPIVKHTLREIDYDRDMTTREQRVLEAIEATGLSEKVVELAEKIGVTKQSVYDWKKGKSIEDMKARFLVKLADLSGYEPLWIMEGRGPKKRILTDEQQKVLFVMQQSEEKQNLVVDIVESVVKHHKDHCNEVVEDRLVSSEHELDQQLSDKRNQK